MASPIYQHLKSNDSLEEMLINFKHNPIGMLSQQFNIPQNFNDPNQILQHLLNTGQISQQQVNNAMQMTNDPIIQNLLRR